MSSKNYLIIILGPTASGKTDVSIQLAKYLNSEIFSCDSRQFFKQLNIGVAKPDETELKQVKHWFISNIDITEHYSISKFENDIIKKLDEYYNDNNIAIMVGGSGLYIKAVCEGVDEMPDFDPNIRNELNAKLESEGIEGLRFLLKKVDPDYYNIVDLRNPQRILRALEVYYATGKAYTHFRKNKKVERNFETIKIGINLDRDELYERINKRVDLMIENGLIEEAKSLYKYKDDNLTALKTIGYKELFMYFDNNISYDKAVELIKRNSRRYARRQITWFKKEKDCKWFHNHETSNIIEYISEKMNNS